MFGGDGDADRYRATIRLEIDTVTADIEVWSLLQRRSRRAINAC